MSKSTYYLIEYTLFGCGGTYIQPFIASSEENVEKYITTRHLDRDRCTIRPIVLDTFVMNIAMEVVL